MVMSFILCLLGAFLMGYGIIAILQDIVDYLYRRQSFFDIDK